MIRLIWMQIESVDGEKATCKAVSNGNIRFVVYLNPLDRQGQANTAAGTRLIALVDDVQGLGVCVYNENGFAFKFGQSVNIDGDISANGDVSATGDVTTGELLAKLSFNAHVHECSAPGTPSLGPAMPEPPTP
jgi:hypothetical protein